MNFTTNAWDIFNQSINDYHKTDDVNAQIQNPYQSADINYLLYKKNWIDTVQWHLEDIIRDPKINPVEALRIKRWIDKSNQERTDMVEYIDSWFLNEFSEVEIKDDATINTESPAWAIDRLSILSLKIFHMQEEVNRAENGSAHYDKASQKLSVLKQQHEDLSTAIEQLIEDLKTGDKKMKVYKQMKMYNDEDFNPVLYKAKS